MSAAQNTSAARQNCPQEGAGEAGREKVLVIQSPQEGGENGVYTHLFSKPLQLEGGPVRSAVFNFRDLRGRDYVAAESEVKAKLSGDQRPENSRALQLHIAAKAAGLNADALTKALPLRDYQRIATAAHYFLSPAG